MPFQNCGVSKQQPRAFSDDERAFLESMADKLPLRECERLRHDIEIARVIVDRDFLLIDLPGYERPEHKGQRSLAFEGEMRAADGGPMTLLVHVDQNERLLEVEFIYWESIGGRAPDWSTLSIVPKPPMRASTR
jgi:hypothetical protein